MTYVGSGKPIPVADPVDRQRLARLERLAAIDGPPARERCALCGNPETTPDEYGGLERTDNETGQSRRNAFYLCEPCVLVFYADMEALRRLGQKGTM